MEQLEFIQVSLTLEPSWVTNLRWGNLPESTQLEAVSRPVGQPLCFEPSAPPVVLDTWFIDWKKAFWVST